MSEWLNRARARMSKSPVPIAPLVPKGRDEDGRPSPIGANDTIGTALLDKNRNAQSADATPMAADFHERAAIAEFEGNLPRRIAEGLAHLQTMQSLPGFSATRWVALIDGVGRFADRWAARALGLGWSEIDLFGCHPVAPGPRVDCRGLCLMLADADVVAMDENIAVVRSRLGGETKYRRWPEDPGAILVWEFVARPEKAP